MALSPVSSTVAERVVTADIPVETSRTYELFTTGMRSFIDGESAIRQFIRKALITARSTFIVYDNQYGNEIDTLIGQNVNNALFDVEIIRMIREALIYDERILNVSDFAITRNGDAVYVSFTVESTEGIITEEVTL
jgi:phage baseplate assembly protein W